MMDQKKWDILRETFDNDELFKGESYVDSTEFEWDIMEWLECDTASPSFEMRKEFENHGYRVYPCERDSFGWLVGAVGDPKTGREIIFG